jgi:hypothetical protein
MMFRSHRPVTVLSLLCLVGSRAQADGLLFAYEGTVAPHDPSAGWIIANACENACHESLSGGYFVLSWVGMGDLVYFSHEIARSPAVPPPTLWVEWRFRSSLRRPPAFYTCDAWFTIDYDGMHELVWMFGDTAVSFSGDDAVFGLNPEEFHTYRFESLDGIHYRIALNGLTFIADAENNPNVVSYLQFGGEGGCGSPRPSEVHSEWDFIRYGTISHGERVVASEPPEGFLDPRAYPALDRFTVTFDSPNYVYVNEITVEVGEGSAPVVLQTRRLDNGPPETVEIILDRPIPFGRRTTFLLDDGAVVNRVNYTYVRGDADADGDMDLRDVAAYQNCFPLDSFSGRCPAFDFDGDSTVSLSDYPLLRSRLTDPRP